MTVAIVGAGEMAEGLGVRCAAAGERLLVTARDESSARALVARLGGDAAVVPYGDPLDADVVFLAVKHWAYDEVLTFYGERLANKILVDLANPVNATYDDLVTPAEVSRAEQTAAAAPEGAVVVKAFNTTFSGPLVAGQTGGLPLDVFLAGDDAAAKARVAELVAGGGMRPIDVGPLRRSRALEAFQLLHIMVQSPLCMGFETQIKLAR